MLRHLVVIDLQEKIEKHVTNDVVDVNKIEIFYEPQSQVLLGESWEEDSRMTNIQAFRAINLESSAPGLVKEQQFERAVIASDYAYEATTSTKGLVIHQTDDEGAESFFYHMTMNNGQQTPLGFAVGGFMNFIFSLPAFPEFPEATVQEVVVGDFLELPKNTPPKIEAFLEKEVTEDKTCRPGERVAFQVEKIIGEQQFRAAAAGCGRTTTMYYVKKVDTYKGIPSGSHGLDCEDRDRYGISPQLAGCRNPNDPM